MCVLNQHTGDSPTDRGDLLLLQTLHGLVFSRRTMVVSILAMYPKDYWCCIRDLLGPTAVHGAALVSNSDPDLPRVHAQVSPPNRLVVWSPILQLIVAINWMELRPIIMARAHGLRNTPSRTSVECGPTKMSPSCHTCHWRR